MSGGEKSSSTRHRDTSERNERDGDGGRAPGDESEHERRPRKGSRRKEEGSRGKGGSRGRHRSRSRDDTRGSSAHRGGGNTSKSAQPPEEGESSLRRRPTDNAEGGIDDCVSVSPDRRISSSSNSQRGGTNAKSKDRDKGDKGAGGELSSEGTENAARQSQRRDRDRRGRKLEEPPRESSLSEHEGTNMSPTSHRRQKSRKKGTTRDGSRDDRDQNSEWPKVDRKQRRRGSSNESSSKRPDETRRGSTTTPAVSEEPVVTDNTGRTRTISRESQHPRGESNTLQVSPTTSGKNGDSTGKPAAADVAMGGAFSDDEDRDGKVRNAQTAVEPAGDVIGLVASRKESLSVSLGNSDSAVPTRNSNEKTRSLPGAGRGSASSGAVEVSTVAWNGNDVEVL